MRDMSDLLPRRDFWRMAAREVWLPTSAEMAELDRAAVESGAIPERALIENAGREVARLLQTRYPEGPVVALAGSGHNGADALVAVRTLAAWGRPVRAVRCGSGPPEPDVLRGWDIPLTAPDALSGALRGSAVLLDGVLGTGLASAPRQPQARILEEANASGLPIVSVDGPSGADFTTGAVPGVCARATLTVTLGWPKLGLLRFPARGFCGDLVAVEIGFPPPRTPIAARAVTAPWARALLTPRPDSAHKGRAGYLALVAGQQGMAGAAVLAARTAVRAGIGIVRVVSAPENREIVQTAVPEAVFVGWDVPRAVEEAVAWADAVAVGPGLGRGDDRARLVETVLERAGDHPVLIDADGLNAWEGRPEELAETLRGPALLTPHPGEMGRLLGREVPEILADPPDAARTAARRVGRTTLLKGAPSWVAEPDGTLRVSTILTAALATGGIGDVLTGLAGAYLAAGLAPADAATAALMVSGLAAARAPEAVGHAASDVPDRIPEARSAIEGTRASAWPGVLLALPAARGASEPE